MKIMFHALIFLSMLGLTVIAMRYKCFNDVEAEMIREQLTEDERARVEFTWMFTIPPDQTEASN